MKKRVYTPFPHMATNVDLSARFKSSQGDHRYESPMPDDERLPMLLKQMEALTEELRKFQQHPAAKNLPTNNFAVAFNQLITAINQTYGGQQVGPKEYIDIIQNNHSIKKALLLVEGDDHKTTARMKLFDETVALMLEGERQTIPDQVSAPRDPQEKLWELLATLAEKSDAPDNPLFPATSAAIQAYVKDLKAQAKPNASDLAPKKRN